MSTPTSIAPTTKGAGVAAGRTSASEGAEDECNAFYRMDIFYQFCCTNSQQKKLNSFLQHLPSPPANL